MEKKQETPQIVKIGAWLLSLIVFAVGFWHTHLGLKEMRPFGSEYGSIAIAAIVLLLLLLTYYFAISGSKIALIFYVFCGLFFFTFNLNYFYPSYLGRQLLKEEATALNDTLQEYSNRVASQQYEAGFENKSKEITDYENLKTKKKQIVTEIRDFSGWGPESSSSLQDFNKISKQYGFPIKQFSNAGTMTREELSKIYDSYLNGIIQQVLQSLMVNTKNGSVQNTLSFLKGASELDSLQINYTPILKESIIPDNSEIELDEVKRHPQIDILQRLVTGINDATSKINNATKAKSYKFSVLEESQSRTLGRIANTFKSVKKRIDKVDTWTIIFICLFIDLLVPLAIYVLLKKKEGQEDKIKPITTPGHF
jgi:hypothetical protein